METSEIYRKHTIEVTTTQVRERAWTWEYAIDRKVFGSSPKGRLLPNAETAMKHGLGAARIRVDLISVALVPHLRACSSSACTAFTVASMPVECLAITGFIFS